MKQTRRDNFYILTGGPGAGKTAVLSELKNRSYKTVAEVGRTIIKQQLDIGGNATHSGDRLAFRDLMLQFSINDYITHLDTKQTVFFDRGIPELAGYSQLIATPITTHIQQAIKHYCYNAKVFLFPPWQEIYCNDTERKQDFAEAIDTYNAVEQAYAAAGYTLIIVPPDTVKNRAEFIISSLS